MSPLGYSFAETDTSEYDVLYPYENNIVGTFFIEPLVK